MRLLKPALVVAATAGIVAAGAATSFAVSGPTAPSLNTTSVSSSSQLNTTANGADRPVLGDSTASAPRAPVGVAPQVPSGASGAQISRQDAIDAALSTAAVGGTVVRAERAQEHASAVWKVRLNTNTGMVDYVVNATTGAVTTAAGRTGLTPQLTSNSAAGEDDGADD